MKTNNDKKKILDTELMWFYGCDRNNPDEHIYVGDIKNPFVNEQPQQKKGQEDTQNGKQQHG